MEMSKQLLSKLEIFDDLNETIQHVKNDILDVKKEIAEKQIHAETTQSVEKVEPTAKKSLVVGDSLVRDFRSKDKHQQIKTLRGKGFLDVQQYLESNDAPFQDICIVAGTNDCTSPTPITLEDTTEHFKQMLAAAKNKAEHVIVSSIPPRCDTGCSDDVLQNITAMNLSMKDICAEENVTFIDNDLNFKYANGDTDFDLLLDDKLHLSQKGSERLICNLGLENTVRCFYQ